MARLCALVVVSSLVGVAFGSCGSAVTFDVEHEVTTSLAQAIDARAGDMDGDGDLDIVAIGQSNAGGEDFLLFLNDGAESFARNVVTNSLDGAYNLYVVDADGDGDEDALSASIYNGEVAWYEVGHGVSLVVSSR